MRDPRQLQAAVSGLWPEAASRTAELLARFPSLPWGAALGRALDDVLPEARLLLDDAHGAETVLDDLLPLLRHFPEGGSLVLASRHRLTELGREVTHHFDAKHPIWQTRIEPAHLLELPEELLGHALALHLLGSQKPDLESQELVRRNVALPGLDHTHHLHPAWASAAERCLAFSLSPKTWERLEKLLAAYAERTLRTTEERSLAAVLARIPSQLLAERPTLAKIGDWASSSTAAIPGERRYHYQAYRELRDRYAQAIASDESAQAQVFATRMIALATRHGFHRDLLEAHVAKLEAQLLLDPALPFEALLDVPGEAFSDLSKVARYERCFARRAAALGEEALARRLGECDEPLHQRKLGFCLRAFGPLELLAPDGSEVKLPRKAARVLLALLTLNPEGMSARELAQRIFGEASATPSEALHTVTYALRNALTSVDGEHLFDASGGLYRLRWHAIASCDLHEFEALMRKAADLEQRGWPEASRLFRRLARAYVNGELFENLPDMFDAERADVVRRAQADASAA
ncbi:hypothetical protein J7643_06390 [bacterium]|nr:hypothetical protein [bacterium]